MKSHTCITWFKDIGISDIPSVGGKNASLGEMYSSLSQKGIRVPNGFAITVDAYWNLLHANNVHKKIKQLLKDLDDKNVTELARVGKKIRALILKQSFSSDIEQEIISAYTDLDPKKKGTSFAVAVRSSATAEDLPDASFAGQQETYLNVRGKKDVLVAVKKCMASLFTDRAISYRNQRGFDHLSVALSVTVQEMVHAESGASGVLFTMDTESGFKGVVLVNASYGLGEYVVQGRVTPDQYYVFKDGVVRNKPAIINKTLGSKEVKLVYGKKTGTKHAVVKQSDRMKFAISDEDVLLLAKWAMIIEQHYGRPQDIEWAKDGKTGTLFIVQARPETVKTTNNHAVIETYTLKKQGKILLQGTAIGQRIGAGKVRIINTLKDMKSFQKGEILVTRITDPDWEPIMRIAAAIITEQGGKTSHAAIVSRELGVPAIVGAKGARKLLNNGTAVTASCANGDDGIIYKGILPFEVQRTELKDVPKTRTKIMMNVGDPEHAFSLSFLPHDGVGLARLEFIFSNFIRIHPLALLRFHELKDATVKKRIQEMTKGYASKEEYCIQKLSEGIARIASAMHPHDVVVRLSDFKTNEYASLIGGKQFEPKEENPMLGWRGASRYYSDQYKDAFRLECEAIKRVRTDWGFTNVIPMIPFCRTPEEGRQVLDTMKQFGLVQGEDGLQVYVMCEIPSNVILAEDFARLFDGFSIGTNDLTQLTLGLDRDSSEISHLYDENNEAVKKMIREVIRVAHKYKKKVGLCGQAPSDSPEFADFLVESGIDSISLNPDTVVSMRHRVAEIEKTVGYKGKRTHKGVLGLLSGFALVVAGFLAIGAGCSDLYRPMPSYSLQDDISPAQIREQVEEKITARLLSEQKNAMTTFSDETLSRVSFSYPQSWSARRFSLGVEITDPQDVQSFLTVTQEDSSSSSGVSPESSTSLVVDGKQAVSYTISDPRDTTTISFLRIAIDEHTSLLFQGKTDRWDDIVSSIRFSSGSSDASRVCAQVVTYARSSADASCTFFPTPCDVPEGWQVCAGVAH